MISNLVHCIQIESTYVRFQSFELIYTYFMAWHLVCLVKPPCSLENNMHYTSILPMKEQLLWELRKNIRKIIWSRGFQRLDNRKCKTVIDPISWLSGVYIRMQEWFDIRKSINIIHHINVKRTVMWLFQ